MENSTETLSVVQLLVISGQKLTLHISEYWVFNNRKWFLHILICLNGLSYSKSTGKWHSESTKFQIFLGEHAPKPPSLFGANHSCKILDPPLQLILLLGGNILPVSLVSDFPNFRETSRKILKITRYFIISNKQLH